MCRFPEPEAKNNNELLVTVKAAAIKHFDKISASGKHSTVNVHNHTPTEIGSDDVGLLEDGTRIYASGD